jgi:hypothetical protein
MGRAASLGRLPLSRRACASPVAPEDRRRRGRRERIFSYRGCYRRAWIVSLISVNARKTSRICVVNTFIERKQ